MFPLRFVMSLLGNFPKSSVAEEHQRVLSCLVLLSSLPNGCSAPKPDVVGSYLTAPVVLNNMGKVEYTGLQ